MKSFLIGFIGMFCLLTSIAFAQDVNPPTADEINAFFASLSSIGGLKGSALILFVVQAAMLGVRQFVQGKYKLMIVVALTLIGSIISGLSQGQNIVAILLSAGALSSLQVFISQVAIQFKKQA